MATADDGGDEEPADALEAFTAGKEEFMAELERIDEEDPEAEIHQIKAMNEFFRTLAPHDPQEALKKQAFSIVKREIPFMDLGRAEKDYNKIASGIGGDSSRPELAHLMRSRVETIEKLAAGETGSEAKYRFNFESGNSLVVDSETLYSPTQMRRAYDGVFDVLPKHDSEDEATPSWEDVVHELKQDRLVAKEDAVGPRTATIQSLRNRVAEAPAYLDAGSAATRNGVYLDVDPDDLDHDEESGEIDSDAGRVWVPSSEIEAVCDDRDISIEALRIEMDNRDLRGGTSAEFGIGEGRKAYFWPLPRGDGPDEFHEKTIEYEPPADEDEADE